MLEKHCVACGCVIPDETSVGIPFLPSGMCEMCDREHNITCPVCLDAPVTDGHGACNACLCDLYADDIRSIHFAAGDPHSQFFMDEDPPF